MEGRSKYFSRDSPQFVSSKGSSNSSALDRIKSGNNIRNSMLPDFMRGSNQQPKSIIMYQAPERPKSPLFTSMDRSKSASPDIENYGGFIQSIFNQSKDPSEIMLRVRQRDIYREDLRCFSSGENLPRSIIDACLSVIKQLNHDFLIKNEANDKVIISSTEFSQLIFCTSKTNIFHAPTYIMKYE